jgi:hypothetical protein
MILLFCGNATQNFVALWLSKQLLKLACVRRIDE